MYNLLTKKSKFKKRIFEIFVGNNVDFTIDQQVLMTVIPLTAISYIFTIPLDIVNKLPNYIILTNTLTSLLFILLYFLIRIFKFEKYISALFIIALFISFSIDWFPNGGIQGSVANFYLVLLGYIIFLTKGIFQKIFLYLYLINISILFLIQYKYPKIESSFTSRNAELFDLYFGFVLTFFFIGLLVYVLKKLYQQEKKNSIDIINQYRKSSKNLKEKYNEVINLLSVREKEVFERIIEGKSNKEIACNLYIDEGTVKNHVTSIYKKLEVNKRIELIKKVNQFS